MNALLETLKSLNAATIYGCTTSEGIVVASHMLRHGSALSIEWSGPETLKVYFADAAVSLSQSPTGLLIKCSLDPGARCVHVPCALMAIMHVLKGSAGFGTLPSDQAAMLRDQILHPPTGEESTAGPAQKRGSGRGSQAKAAPLTTYVELHPHDTLLQPVSYRSPASNLYLTAITPPEIRPFATQWLPPGEREQLFREWFTSGRTSVPVAVTVDDTPQRLFPPLLEASKASIALHLNGQGDAMIVSLAGQATLSDGQTLTVTPVGEHLGIDLENSRIVWIKDPKPWRLHREIVYASKSFDTATPDADNGLRPIGSPADWTSLAVAWNKTLADHCAFFREGVRQEPQREPHQGSLSLTPMDNGFCVVELEVTCGSASLPHANLAMDVEWVLAGRRSGGRYRLTKTKTRVLQRIWHWLALADKPVDRKNIKAVMQLDPSLATNLSATEAEKHLNSMGVPELGAAETLLATAEGGWVRTEHAGKTARLVAALAMHHLQLTRQFPEDMPDSVRDQWSTDDFDDVDDAIVVADLNVVDQALTRLHADCVQTGVVLRWNGSRVREASDCLVQISATEARDRLDWFELKPEIMCEGELVPQEKWEQIVLRGQFLTGKNELVILSATDASQLNALRGWLAPVMDGKGKRARGKEPLIEVPRLRMLDWLMLTGRGVKCVLPPADREVLESLLSFESLPILPVPTNLNAKMRDYQVAGFSWFAFLYRHRFGACLADDMGLGKTLQTIALMAARATGEVPVPDGDPTPRPHLVVVPPTLLFNWRHEIEAFCPTLVVQEYTGKNRAIDRTASAVVLTTYELVRRDIESLKDIPFDVVVFDEAQNVKNLAGGRSQAMRQLTARFKVALTGTPLENRIGEYFSIIDLVLPGLLGTHKEFIAAVKDPGPVSPLDRTRPFVLRRTKEKILTELPPKVESDMWLDLSPSQRSFYTRAVAEVKEEVFRAYADQPAQQAGIVALSALMRLRQICVSPALLDPDHREISPKMEHLTAKLLELHSEGHAALVFSSFTKALDVLERSLTEAGVAFLRLDGSTPQARRKTLVAQFQSGDGPGTFLISVKAGGAGLNLTRASYVFHLDPWWNPAVENQASDRAHRFGQTQTVFVNRLIMRHTVEEKIMVLKEQKRQLFERVLSGAEARATGSPITRDDIDYLLA